VTKKPKIILTDEQRKRKNASNIYKYGFNEYVLLINSRMIYRGYNLNIAKQRRNHYILTGEL
jgi:hypothetical protein